jgi:hypothetical protein
VLEKYRDNYGLPADPACEVASPEMTMTWYMFYGLERAATGLYRSNMLGDS